MISTINRFFPKRENLWEVYFLDSYKIFPLIVIISIVYAVSYCAILESNSSTITGYAEGVKADKAKQLDRYKITINLRGQPYSYVTYLNTGIALYSSVEFNEIHRGTIVSFKVFKSDLDGSNNKVKFYGLVTDGQKRRGVFETILGNLFYFVWIDLWFLLFILPVGLKFLALFLEKLIKKVNLPNYITSSTIFRSIDKNPLIGSPILGLLMLSFYALIQLIKLLSINQLFLESWIPGYKIIMMYFGMSLLLALSIATFWLDEGREGVTHMTNFITPKKRKQLPKPGDFMK